MDGPGFESLGFNLTWSPSSLQWAIEDTSNRVVPSLHEQAAKGLGVREAGPVTIFPLVVLSP